MCASFLVCCSMSRSPRYPGAWLHGSLAVCAMILIAPGHAPTCALTHADLKPDNCLLKVGLVAGLGSWVGGGLGASVPASCTGLSPKGYSAPQGSVWVWDDGHCTASTPDPPASPRPCTAPPPSPESLGHHHPAPCEPSLALATCHGVGGQ